MATHKELEVWRQAIELSKIVYQLTVVFPPSELYGLVSQMRRSAVSIASDIAEGAARATDKEFIHFLHITLGSLAELDTQYILARELGLAETSIAVETGIENVRKMTLGLIKYLKAK